MRWPRCRAGVGAVAGGEGHGGILGGRVQALDRVPVCVSCYRSCYRTTAKWPIIPLAWCSTMWQ
jgi:hypothetical protein